MKCYTCKIEKPSKEFYKNKQNKSGFSGSCKACKKAYASKYQKDNRRKVSDYYLSWYYKNKDKARKNSKKWYLQNKHKNAAKQRKREARKLRAVPPWLSEEDHKRIEIIYGIRELKSFVTGIEHHVDHIVPLQGKNVCGLHVPWNLRVVPATENLHKSNKYV